MAGQEEDGMKLDELAKRTGFSPRTIRLYITRGLLPGPLRRGRGAVYGREHLQRLGRVRTMQARGLTLKEIGRRLDTGASEPGMRPPTSCWQYAVSKDVLVTVRAEVSPWRRRQIDNALTRFAAELAGSGKESAKHESDR